MFETYTEKSVHLNFILFFPLKEKKTKKKSDNLDKLALFIDFFLSVIHDSQVTCSQRFW